LRAASSTQIVRDDRSRSILHSVAASSGDEEEALVVVECAALYTAFHAFRALGELPTPLVSEIEEDVLDELDQGRGAEGLEHADGRAAGGRREAERREPQSSGR